VESFGQSGEVAAGQDPEIDEDLAEHAESNEQTPLDRLLSVIEDKMLFGWSRTRIVRWCRHLGLQDEITEQIYCEIRSSWAIGGTGGYQEYCEKRDLIRARLHRIFEAAMSKGDLKNALSATKQLVDLDGLEAPKTVNINANATVTHQITNASRETVAALMERMKHLAEAKRMRVLRAKDGAEQAIAIQEAKPWHQPPEGIRGTDDGDSE